MNKVTMMEHTLAVYFLNWSQYFRRPSTLENSTDKVKKPPNSERIWPKVTSLSTIHRADFWIWIWISYLNFQISLLTYLHKYSYLLIFLLQKFLPRLFVNFQCQAKLFDWFFAKLVIVQWQNQCKNDRHSLLFFALLIWWLVGSAGLLVGHPFDTLKVRLTLTYLIWVWPE